MKPNPRRLRKILNFAAFNLLFFALYLNFIHKDQDVLPVSNKAVAVKKANATQLVANPDQYLKEKELKQLVLEKGTAVNQ